MFKNIITVFSFFFKILKYRILLLYILMILAVFMEFLGLSFALPLLEGIHSENKFNAFFKSFLNTFGFEYKLSNLLILLVIVVSFRAIFMVTQSTYLLKNAADLLVMLREKLAMEIFQIDYQQFLGKSSGYINNALMTECQMVVSCFITLMELTVSALFVAVYVVIPLYIQPSVFMVVFVASIPIAPLILYINKKTKYYSRLRVVSSENLQKILIQSVHYFKYLKATAQYPKVLEKIFYQTKKLGKIQLIQNFLGAICAHGFEPFVAIILATIIYYYVEIKGRNIIEFLFILFLLYRALQHSLGLQKQFRNLLSFWASVEVVQNFSAEVAQYKEIINTDDQAKIIDFRKSISFKNVSFAYQNTNKEVLKNINFEIPANSTIAFVGESGSGKSTLVNLIIGLLKPTEGNIYIGDKDYSDIDILELRKHIGYITQEDVVFNDNIYNNITLWDNENDDSRAKVKQSAKQAHLEKFIENLPECYQAMLGESGVNISGGQKQRICIARELYKDTKVLVFDEATSSLDTKTEKEIQKNIDEFKGLKTVVIIAHRLSTIINCDNIIVLKDGEIVEKGTFSKLYSKSGEFKKMVDLQHGENIK